MAGDENGKVYYLNVLRRGSNRAPRPASGIDYPDVYEQALDDPQRRRRVANVIARLVKKRSIEMDWENTKIVFLKDELEAGTVHVVGRNGKRLMVASSSDFPKFLLENEMSELMAINTAANFTLAYTVILQKIAERAKARHLTTLPTFRSSFEPRLWTPEYGIGNAAKLTTPYRAAGCVAINSLQLSTPLPGLESQPPHVAGLVNPISSDEFRQLYTAF